MRLIVLVPCNEPNDIMPTILIVDDTRTNREYLSAILRDAGHQTLLAADGAEGLACARRERPNAIITDLLMPTMNGYDFVRQLRAEPAIATTPVIFCTAHFQDGETASLVRSCGVCGVLDKGAEPNVVLRTVRAALARKSVNGSHGAMAGDLDRENVRLLADKLWDKSAQESAERDKTQMLLRQSEERFRGVVEGSMQGIMIRSGERIEYVNPAYARIFGYEDPGEIVGESWVKLVASEELPVFHAREATCLQGQVLPLHPGWQGIRKDGTRIWLESTARPFAWEGRPALLAFVSDITERKQAEQALAERVRLSLLIADVCTALTREAKLPDMLRSCAEALVRHLDAAFARVWTLHAKDQVLQLQASAGLYTHLDGPHACIPVGKFKIGLIALERRPHLTNTVVGDARVGDQEWARREGMVAFAGYPLIVDQKLVGVMALFARHTLSETTLQAMGAVADQVALGIERKRGNQALYEREELYRLLTENTNDLIYLLDVNGRIFFASPSIQHLRGMAVERVVGASAFAGIHPEDLAAVTAAWERVLQGQDVTIIYRLQHADGSWRWIETFGSLVQYQGQPRVLAVGRDMTEHKQAEQDRALLTAILEMTPDFVGVATPDGRITYVNPAGRRLVGIADDTPLTVFSEYHPEWALQLINDEGIPTAIESGSWIGETALLTRDGNEVPCSQLIVAHKNRAGSLTHLSTICRDITDRQRAEEAIRAAQKQLQHVVTSSPAVLYSLSVEADKLGGMIWISDNIQQLLGYSPEEAAAATWWFDHLHPDDREPVSSSTQHQLFGQGSAVHEYRIRHKNGSYRWLRSEIRLLRDQAGRPLEAVGSWSDVTDRKDLEEQYRQSQKMDAIGRLAGGVAHDFNNLLTIILGYSDVLVERLPAGDVSRDFVAEIGKAGRRASGLTRQLLAFSRKQILVPEIVELDALLSDMEKMLRKLIGEDIDLKYVADRALWKVKVDRGQMEQVVLNLAVNARDAMPRGGKLTIQAVNYELDDSYAQAHPPARPGQYVVISVTDTGCGMDEATRLRIFEPFFTTKGPDKGTGLGLSTVYGIVKQSNGLIEVHSEVGSGTTFRVFLPRAAENVSKKLLCPAEAAAQPGIETVLLVEDEPGVRMLARMVLESAGYAVLAARHGGEALLLSQNHRDAIHILLSDVVMPDMSGPDLAQQLAASRPGMKCLFLSGYTDDSIVRHGIVDGTVPLLQKPFSQDGLLKKVREILDTP